jgi:hypothetical protein
MIEIKERTVKTLHIEVSSSEHITKAEEILKDQYDVNEKISWIHCASFKPWTGEQVSSSYSTSIQLEAIEQ